ncbi:hypothetical protein HMN09_01193700 [Mycena chlorophos]|uniref:Uncharacterized protein n=1 Tax=Mycena chlorophos TaxID=658473 RepID=A0A8H6S7D5_MYCCL|nr:hypothetical protein HMN09_01193700 [Mycena chlorophos]
MISLHRPLFLRSPSSSSAEFTPASLQSLMPASGANPALFKPMHLSSASLYVHSFPWAQPQLTCLRFRSPAAPGATATSSYGLKARSHHENTPVDLKPTVGLFLAGVCRALLFFSPRPGLPCDLHSLGALSTPPGLFRACPSRPDSFSTWSAPSTQATQSASAHLAPAYNPTPPPTTNSRLSPRVDANEKPGAESPISERDDDKLHRCKTVDADEQGGADSSISERDAVPALKYVSTTLASSPGMKKSYYKHTSRSSNSALTRRSPAMQLEELKSLWNGIPRSSVECGRAGTQREGGFKETARGG